MSSAELTRLFVQIAVMLGVAVLCGHVATQLRAPTVLGELAGGIVLGPTVLGALAPGTFGWLFPPGGAIVLARDALLKLCVLFFMFAAGLEIDLSNVRREAPRVGWVALAGMTAPFALGCGAVLLAPAFWGAQTEGASVRLALFLGTALAISALPVIARILIDLDLIRQPVGIIVMIAAAINDIVGWALFTAILSAVAPTDAHGRPLWQTLMLAAALCATLLTIGRRTARRFIAWANMHPSRLSSVIALVVVMMLLASAVAEAIGVHAALGAFLVGVAFATHAPHSEAIHRHTFSAITQFALSCFAPLYFVSVGLKVNFAAHFDLLLVITVLVVASVGKIVGASAGARLGGMAWREALAVGFGLNARGAVEIILAAIALDRGLVDQRLFVALVVMALATSLLSGPVMRRLLMDRAPPMPAFTAVTQPLREDNTR